MSPFPWSNKQNFIIIIIIIDTSSWYASEEHVSNNFFRHSLDDNQKSYVNKTSQK